MGPQALQKKLRDIGSLRKKQAEGSKLDKLQEENRSTYICIYIYIYIYMHIT